MSGRHLVNHNGRVTEKEVEAIKASDLLKLMDVVKEATGIYNELERAKTTMTITLSDDLGVWGAWDELGSALRALGLMEVSGDAG